MNLKIRVFALAVLTGLMAGLFLSALAPAPTRAACDCPELPSPYQAMSKSAAVFSGTVTAVDALDDIGMNRISFDVDRVWRHRGPGAFSVLSPQSADDCGLEFEIGKAYIVYAIRRDVGSLQEILFSDQCSRTRPPNEEEVRALSAPCDSCRDLRPVIHARTNVSQVRAGEVFTLYLEAFYPMTRPRSIRFSDPSLVELLSKDEIRFQDGFQIQALRPGVLEIHARDMGEIGACDGGLGCVWAWVDYQTEEPAVVTILPNPDFPTPTNSPTTTPTRTRRPTRTPTPTRTRHLPPTPTLGPQPAYLPFLLGMSLR